MERGAAVARGLEASHRPVGAAQVVHVVTGRVVGAVAVDVGRIPARQHQPEPACTQIAPFSSEGAMSKPGVLAVGMFLTVAVAASSAGAEERIAASRDISPQVIQQAIASAQLDVRPASRVRRESKQSATSSHTGRRVLWTAVGATGGFFAGGYVGAAIENAVSPCGCDDAGLMGALIGMPIGAAAGGITGFLLSK